MFHVHIGAHKTGSSTLQRFFRLNAPLLAEAGVAFPSIGSSGLVHHGLARAAQSGPEALRDLARFAAQHTGGTYLLSSEVLEILGPEAIRRFVGALAPHPIRVLLYVREFTRLLPSKYAQRTKFGGNIDDFDAFFERAMAEDMLAAYRPAANWAAVVGWENIRVRSLDPRSLAAGGLIADALEAVGLDAALLARCDPATLRVANAAPHWIAVEMMRAISLRLAAAGERIGPADDSGGKGKRAVARVLDACSDAVVEAGLAARDARYLAPEQWRALADRYRVDIDRLAEKAPGPRLPEAAGEPPGPRPFLPSLEVLSGVERRALRDALAASPAVSALSPILRGAVLASIDDSRPPATGLGARLAGWRRRLRTLPPRRGRGAPP